MLEEDRVRSTAEAITRYLSSRPNASETVEGVAKWWLVRQRYEESLELVQHALNYLVTRGQVEVVRLSGGNVLYRRPLPREAANRPEFG